MKPTIRIIKSTLSRLPGSAIPALDRRSAPGAGEIWRDRMDRPTHAYFGLKRCGCFAFIGGDEPELAEHIADDAKYVITQGGTVERLPLDEAKTRAAAAPYQCGVCK